MQRQLTDEWEHRPWPLPAGEWVQEQVWNDLLLAHWPIPTSYLRSLVPEELELETYDGTGWVSITPFWISGLHLRGLPPVPFVSQFPEINVRTYVRVEDKPGLYFFSLDAGHPVAVTAARTLYFLPYYTAQIEVNSDGPLVLYNSERQVSDDTPEAEFSASYGPINEVFTAGKDSFDYWLTERYCLYTFDGSGQLYRGNIHHLPHPLQRADAVINKNTMAQANRIDLPEDFFPLLHYIRRQDVLIWPLEKVDGR